MDDLSSTAPEQTEKTSGNLENKRSPEAALSQSTNTFLLKLDALLETVNRIMLIVTKSRQRAEQELIEYVSPLIKANGGQPVTLSVEATTFRNYLKYVSAKDKAIEAERIVPQSFLVSMVNQYDAFLATMIRNLFLLKPEKIRSGDRSISVKEIVRFSSIDEVLQELIDTEIDEILRDSHTKQIQWIAKKFDFTIDTGDELIQKFIEVTERRNLYVHAEGAISKQYVERTSDLNNDIVSTRELGAEIRCGRNYMSHARNTLFETAIRLSQIAWRKLRPDQCQEQDQLIITTIYELLAREDFTLARNISDFAGSLRGMAGELNKRTLCVNRAQAYKWSGKNDEAKKIIGELDWSASTAKFQLAAAVINDDTVGASALIEAVPVEGKDGISVDSYRMWPLFREIRKIHLFQEAFRQKFGEPLLLLNMEIAPTAENLTENKPN